MIVRTASFLDDLRRCFLTALEADVAVAFLTTSGLVATRLKTDIEQALKRGLRLRILVDLSAGVTDPKALRALLQLQERGGSDIRLRAYLPDQGAILHTKLYIFKNPDGSCILTGSANWTEAALSQVAERGNKEHGLLVAGADADSISHADLLFRTCGKIKRGRST
jgi:HKD family nuclease